MTVRVGKRGSAQLGYSRPTRNPLSPIDNPFGYSDEQRPFRLGVFLFLEEHDDYLVCRGYDPNAALEAHTPAAHKTITVAKPSLLMRTPWDGQSAILTVDGIPTAVTYEYSDEVGKRTARATVDGEDIEEIQRITMDYHVGDIIVAVQVKHNATVDGIPRSAAESYDFVPPSARPDITIGQSIDAGGLLRLTWVDLNYSARCWAVSDA